MAASTSTGVPSTQDEDISLLRAVLGRTSREVKDYTVQYEEQAKVVEALGAAVNTPEHAAAIDVLVMRERRLDSALGREANALQKLTDFCVADKSALQAQSAAAAAILSPSPVVGGATTSTTVPSSSASALSKKLIKRKLPEPDDGWKDHSGKTHKKHNDQMVYHKTVSGIFWADSRNSP